MLMYSRCIADDKCCNCSRRESANKKYTLARMEPGTFHTESKHSTIQLLRTVRTVDPTVAFKADIMQSRTELTFIQCCIKPLYIQLLLYATF